MRRPTPQIVKWFHSTFSQIIIIIDLPNYQFCMNYNQNNAAVANSRKPITLFPYFLQLVHRHLYSDSKVHEACMGPRWVPCRPHEPCYQDSFASGYLSFAIFIYHAIFAVVPRVLFYQHGLTRVSAWMCNYLTLLIHWSNYLSIP